MKKAYIYSRYSVKVIDYDNEVNNVDSLYNHKLIQDKITDEFIDPILKKDSDSWTVEEMNKIIERKKAEDSRDRSLKELSEFKEFVPSEFIGDLGELDETKPYYVEEGGAVLQKWEIVKNEIGKVSSKIAELKSRLSDSDYKITKCYESSLIGSEMPYDVNSLVKERDNIREEINKLENIKQKP